MRKIFLFLSLLFIFNPLFSRDYIKKVYLWRGVYGMETQVRDTVLYFCPADKNEFPGKKKAGSAAVEKSGDGAVKKIRPAVIICPGGSYHHLGMPHEGFASARWFNSIGINAFVLQYRVAYNGHHYPEQLEDIQMAVVHVRDNAAEYGIDPAKVGAIGYSAGGHLVTMAGEFADTHNELLKLGIETKTSVRPDFVMPVYPVVTMDDDIGHKWSRKSLLGHVYDEKRAEKGFSIFNIKGEKYTQAYKDEFSMEKNVPDNMPPVFLLACRDDPVVIYENSVRLDAALTAKNIPHLFVTYPKGGHGFGMKENSYIMKNTHWNDKDLLPWLKSIGVVK
jgi:acetyl esterase/lipase